MERGRVKWFSAEKGYGFITPDNGGKDLFVHHSGIDMEGYRSLDEGQQVEFNVLNAPKGPQASDVRLIGESATQAPTRGRPVPSSREDDEPPRRRSKR